MLNIPNHIGMKESEARPILKRCLSTLDYVFSDLYMERIIIMSDGDIEIHYLIGVCFGIITKKKVRVESLFHKTAVIFKEDEFDTTMRTFLNEPKKHKRERIIFPGTLRFTVEYEPIAKVYFLRSAKCIYLFDRRIK